MPEASDLLDILGLLMLAAGLGCAAHGGVVLLGRPGTVAVGAGLVVAAVTVLVGSWLSDRRREDG